MENKEITEKIIGCAYKVYNKMGFGFLESIYEKCLIIEFKRAGLKVESQKKLTVFYEKEIVGEFIADIIINNIIIELKSVQKIIKTHEVQLVNYLVATGLDTGLIINFGPEKVSIKRKYREPAGIMV